MSTLFDTQPPLSEDIVQQAILWRIRLESGEAGFGVPDACLTWRQSHPDHELAWQRLAKMDAVFESTATRAPQLARDTLVSTDSERRKITRRRALRMLGGSAFGVVGISMLANEKGTLSRFNADYATRVGERMQFVLPDSSSAWLNTNTALNLNSDRDLRQVSLAHGEVQLEVASDSRPFQVVSQHGKAYTTGGRILVRQEPDFDLVEVQAGEARLQAVGRPTEILAEAGQLHKLSRHGSTRVSNPEMDYSAWIEGVLSVRNMPLKQVLDEVSRYRTGFLRCDPALAGVQVSGVYQLHDTDRILQALARSANGVLRYRTRWWAEVVTS